MPLRRLVPRLIAAVIASLALASCGSSPSTLASPSATPAPANPTVTGLVATGPAPAIGASAQFTATATMTSGPTQTVTGQATWSSTNVSVATVNATGVVTAVAAGEADIAATYLGAVGRVHVTVVRLLYTVGGRVTDGTSGGVLPNIRLQISGGVDAGKSATTDGNGRYVLGAVTPGTFTLTASATSYQTTPKTVTVSGNTTVDFVLPRTAPVPAPVPPPTPPTPTPGPTPSPGPGPIGTYNWAVLTGQLEFCTASLCLDFAGSAVNRGTGCATNVWFHVEFYSQEFGNILTDILVFPVDSTPRNVLVRPGQTITFQTDAVFNISQRHITGWLVTTHYTPVSCQ